MRRHSGICFFRAIVINIEEKQLGEKTYKCDQCLSIFLINYELMLHKRSHTGIIQIFTQIT